MRHGYVGAEHLLLACHGDADWLVSQLLARMGATGERVRADIERVLKQSR